MLILLAAMYRSTKAAPSGVQLTLLPHTSCSFKECDFLSTNILRGGGIGCHLCVVPPGQLLRRPRTPSPCDRRMFRDLLNFLRSICEKNFSCVDCFRVC